MLGFEGAQLIQQPVVFGVRHFGVVEDVVAIIMARDLRTQFQRPGLGAAQSAARAAAGAPSIALRQRWRQGPASPALKGALFSS